MPVLEFTRSLEAASAPLPPARDKLRSAAVRAESRGHPIDLAFDRSPPYNRSPGAIMNSVLRKCWPAILIAAAPILLVAQDKQKLTDEQMERVLQTAKIVNIKNISTGVTNSRRATLDDGTMQHDAHVQSIDEAKAKFE